MHAILYAAQKCVAEILVYLLPAKRRGQARHELALCKFTIFAVSQK
jgi:hypothetical protein